MTSVWTDQILPALSRWGGEILIAVVLVTAYCARRMRRSGMDL